MSAEVSGSGRGRGRGRETSGNGAHPNEPGATDPNGLQRLINNSWHIAGVLHAERERVLLPRRCAFMMPPPPQLMQYIRQPVLNTRCSCATSSLTLPSSPRSLSAGDPRLIRSTSRGASAPSPSRMWRIT
ncbi:hypothetical protein PIB30_014854 [Stylosanthes scabra]|uniref:Uncharacterized protein n=1 Tax=Stylosanthes scabra TaxID=79078 RepID=A0ABU6S6P8_9FABA|nr:hypothetical protein [Stylosanthes scabra]